MRTRPSSVTAVWATNAGSTEHLHRALPHRRLREPPQGVGLLPVEDRRIDRAVRDGMEQSRRPRTVAQERLHPAGRPGSGRWGERPIVCHLPRRLENLRPERAGPWIHVRQ
ncbi:MAG: hypothetical protein EBS51_14710 [Planctomycetia bacterium]|nr:hypothetical protein [Planctomycetia bacterium]